MNFLECLYILSALAGMAMAVVEHLGRMRAADENFQGWMHVNTLDVHRARVERNRLLDEKDKTIAALMKSVDLLQEIRAKQEIAIASETQRIWRIVDELDIEVAVLRNGFE